MNEDKSGISPEEIRAIRTDLGLSQVEAGKLLGGGPRAFTKYEAGTVKPAASVVALLRVLEANPDMIHVLRGDDPGPRGGRPRPIVPAPGAGPFEVAGEHITALNERWFPRLLRRLLSAEALAHDLPADGIHVAGNVTAPDGGEDGRIEWTGGPDRTAFLPSRIVQFQLKAGKISPAAAGREILTGEGEIKDMVRSSLEAGGHYVMLSVHPCAQKGIEARKTRIREALRGAGMTVDDDQVHFRDADQIAAWVNRHPSVAIWVKEQTQPGAIGPFRSWFHWANRAEHHVSSWVEDERLSELRTHLRERVAEPHGIARVVGLWGVGKSRLILEAFDPDAEEAGAPLPGDLVFYADESEAGPVAIGEVVRSLADMGTRAVVVVDSCVPDTHRILADMASHRGSRLSLVTIDDEIPSGTPDKTTFKVGEAPFSVIEAVIDQVSPGLPSEDRRRLVRFSKGFPKIAISTGQAWAESMPVAHATADDLADAFVLGRRPRESEQLLRKSAALLAVFGLVETEPPAGGEADGEICEIAARGRDLTAADLRAAVRELGDRGVVQRRGRFAMLQPRPIAMRLAERQWREWSPTDWDDVLAGDAASPRLRTMAARQLALLNTAPISKEVVSHVCRPGGPFDSIEEYPKAVHAEVLSSLAEIAPEVVATRIGRCLDGVGDLSRVRDDTRRHLVWALEKIAFHPDTFEDGARHLLRLAVAENERSISNNATGQFKALFPMLLGNTAADGNARLSILDEASDTDDPIQRSVVVEALITGSETAFYSRSVGAETHGSRPALESWYPATKAAAADYIEGCVKRLARFAEREDESGVVARAGLGRHLRSLISAGFLDTVEEVVRQVDDGTGRWTEAMESLGHFLEYDAEGVETQLEPLWNDVAGMERNVTARVRALIAELNPKSLESRVRFLVTEMPWDFPCGEKLDSNVRGRRQVETVRALAIEIVEQPVVLSGVLPQLSRGEQRMAHVFGEAVAGAIGLGDSSVGWLDRIALAVAETPENERSFALLSGYVTGLAEHHSNIVEAFKRRAAQSPDLASALPLICWRLGIKPSDIGLIIGALRTDLLPVWRLRQWTLGGVLAEVPASEVATLFDTMLDHSAEAFTEAMGLMWTYAHGAPDRLDDFRPSIRKAAENVARWKRLQGNAMADFHFENIMKWMLGKGRQDPDARATALALATALVSVADWNEGRIMKSVVSTLLSDFPEIAWPIIGQAIVSDRGQAWRLKYVFLGDFFSFKQEKSPTILSLPEDALFAWCRAHPGSAPAFVAGVVPILTTYRNDASERSLHPVIHRLIDEFGDRSDMLKAVSLNMGSFGWSGSVTNYFALYREPLRTLYDHPKWQVRRWVKTMLRHLDTRIEHARNEDEEQDAEWEI